MSVIELDSITAGYGKVDVIHGLSLRVEAGEVVALLGPNGAGKTTTVRTVCGQLPVTRGRVTVLGGPVRVGKPYAMVRRGLSILPFDRGIARSLSVQDNLRLRSSRRSAIERILADFPALTGLMSRRVSVLSGGEQQMVALACALLLQPRALIIDEMSTGLAPSIVRRLLPSIRKQASEHDTAVLLVEQSTEAALEVADRAYVLRHGVCVLESDAHALALDHEALAESYLGARSNP